MTIRTLRYHPKRFRWLKIRNIYRLGFFPPETIRRVTFLLIVLTTFYCDDVGTRSLTTIKYFRTDATRGGREIIRDVIQRMTTSIYTLIKHSRLLWTELRDRLYFLIHSRYLIRLKKNYFKSLQTYTCRVCMPGDIDSDRLYYSSSVESKLKRSLLNSRHLVSSFHTTKIIYLQLTLTIDKYILP